MKKVIQLLAICLALNSICWSQNKLESSPTLLGVTLGDDFSKWENKLKYEGSRENLNKFNYIINGEKTIAGTPIEKIDFMFNKASKRLESLFITTKKFKSGVWNEEQFKPIFELLKQEFGDPVSYTADNESSDVISVWETKSNVLIMKYDWGGSSLSEYTNKVDVFLALKGSINSSEKL